MSFIAAIYARKSTSQRGAAKEDTSVERQRVMAEAFIASRGWTLGSVYTDDGISGTEGARLVERAKMLEAADRGEFQVLVLMDLERLSRDDEATPGLVYALRDAGVAVWTYSDGQRIDVSDVMARGMLNMKSMAGALVSEKASRGTREGRIKRLRDGYWTSPVPFGYRGVRVGDRHGHTVLEIHEGEAEAVRRLFALSAQGIGINRLARQANAEFPGMRKWSAQGVRVILTNELYIGRTTFGKSTTVKRKGKKHRVDQPDQSQWVTVERPEWRIVSDELWQQVRERAAATFATYLRTAGGRLSGKPEQSTLASKYLLSGLVRCDHCGGSMVVWSHRGRAPPLHLRHLPRPRTGRLRELPHPRGQCPPRAHRAGPARPDPHPRPTDGARSRSRGGRGREARAGGRATSGP